MEDLNGVIVRRLRLREEHLPVPIFTLSSDDDGPRPIEPDWMCVVRWSDHVVPPRREVYELAFYRDDGEWLEGLQYDTLEIALDQASDLIRVEREDWEEASLPAPDRPGESRLSDWAPIDAFPSSLRPSVEDPRFRRCLPDTDLDSAGQFTVNVAGEQVHIPYRIYNPPPADEWLARLAPHQQRMIHCLFTRHHDGHVRQHSVERIIGSSEAWVIPYILRLLGEYVVEIIDVILQDLPETPDVRAAYVQFCRDNEDFVHRTAARATSYWNCYYRNEFSDRADYPGLVTLRRLCQQNGL